MTVDAEKKSSLKSFLIKFVISLTLLYLVFRKINFSEILHAVKSADVQMLLFAVIVFFVTNAVILFRWKVLIAALNLEVRNISIVRYFLLGLFCNLFMPSAIGGDAIKVLGLCRETTQKTKVVATTVIDRLSGFAGISLLAIVSFVIGFKYVNESSIKIAIAGISSGSLLIAVILFNQKIYSFCCMVFKAFPKIQYKLMELHYDIALLKHNKKAGVLAIVLSMVSQTLLAFDFYLIMKALHFDVSLIYFLIFSPLVCVVSTLPSIGGLGVRELGWVYFLAKVNISEEIAASMSLLGFGLMIVVGLCGGLFYAVSGLKSGNPVCDELQKLPEV